MLWIRKHLLLLFVALQILGALLFYIGDKIEHERLMLFGGVLCSPFLLGVLIAGVVFVLLAIYAGIQQSLSTVILRWKLYFEYF